MDLYVVDANWLKTDSVDSFSSLIWTERYNASGDCTLVVPASSANRALITEGTFLYTPVSKEIILIDTISIQNNEMTATGNTLVDFFKQRLFRSTWQTASDSWGNTGISASAMINSFVTLMTQAGGYINNGQVLTSAQGTPELIPNLTIAAAIAGSNISAAIEFGNLYDAIKTTADLDSIGFILYPPSLITGTGALTFQTYRGLDRTTSQSVNSVVIFDPALDTLTNVRELRSISGYKNVCWVWPNGTTAQNQVGVAYAPGASGLTSWARRTMMLEATDVNVTDYSATDLAAILTQKGRDALANNNYVRMVDGTLVPQNAFVYGTDYNLGDVIELRGNTGLAQSARVTEYIRTQDATGEKAYPTLSVIG